MINNIGLAVMDETYLFYFIPTTIFNIIMIVLFLNDISHKMSTLQK